MTRAQRIMGWVALLACLAGGAAAQDYPTRLITMIVPYPAGGPTDQLARMLAPRLSEKLGQNVIVENVSGGGTNIGTGRVVNAAADGYTLLLHNLQISANVSLYPKLPFDIEKSLTPVIFINNNPLVLVGRKSLPADTLPELVAWMKKNTAKFAHPGVGATGHLTTSLFAQSIGAEIDLLPYRGAAPALQDIVAGHVDLFYGTPQQVIEVINSGLIKAFGVTARQPLPQLPQVPSMVGAISPKLEILYWHALLVSSGTPKPIVDKLNATMRDIMDEPALLKTWAESSVTAYPKEQRTLEAAGKIMHSEVERWGEVVRANKIEGPN